MLLTRALSLTPLISVTGASGRLGMAAGLRRHESVRECGTKLPSPRRIEFGPSPFTRQCQDYSSGDRHVHAGSEAASVARWREFLEWTRDSAPGFVSAKLVRDAGDTGHYISLGEWESAAAAAAWMTFPDFAARYGAYAALCARAQGSRYTLQAEVR